MPIGAAVDRLTRWWVPVLAVAGMAMFLIVPLGPAGVTGPLLLLIAFGLLGRDLRRPRETVDGPAPVVAAAA
ncbi:hypothetical protein [Actinoplanes auranticolor]|uniref:Uncharacterized protein n=1 Tax=Actinoplanes auranticolor TaxID=47988 RepID=A0A919SXF3_9ACTN|nr:hypothetical protein [Actinoplanes auranticolor]GIM78893.1 hypothetical protein Aau02nite_83030 [Actinoplanes auranticolor]